jgi:hypothetical protein
MKEKGKSLDEIREKMTPFQKDLLTEIWEHFRVKGDWPILRKLYKEHGQQAVKKSLTDLTGNVGWEESGPGRWGRIRLSLRGVLLTRDGLVLQKLMARFFQFQRDLFNSEPEKEHSTSAEIANALHLTPDETALLGQLLWLDSFGGSRGGQDGAWTVSAMEEAAAFPKDNDLSIQVESWVCRYNRDDAVVLQEQRMAQYSGAQFEKGAGSGTSQTLPPEIAVSLERLRAKYPDPKKLGFLIMRFTAAKPFASIVQIIKETAEKHGLTVIRADEQELHADVWGNVRTYLHGCGFGIAVYERIETDEPNANVGLEVGYLMAMNKPVLLLKDKTVEVLQADLAGKLYKPFDPHDPQNTIPEHLEKWLKDYGIVV